MTHDKSPRRAWPPYRVAQWLTILMLVVASELCAWMGHRTLSYALDTVAVVTYVGFRRFGLSRVGAARTGSGRRR